MKIAFFAFLLLSMSSCKSTRPAEESETRGSRPSVEFDGDPAVAFDPNPDFIDEVCDREKLKICHANSGGRACFELAGCPAP
jgi:hypothetical protein